MKLLKSERIENHYSLEVEISVESVKTASDVAFKKLVKSSKIPGFRPGKAPRHVFEKFFGTEGITQEAVTTSVRVAYSDIIESLNLEVIDYPQNLRIGEFKENEPIVFSCTVDVVPFVTLGDYTHVRVEKKTVFIEESDIEKKLEELQQQHAEFVLSNEPCVNGDIVQLNLTTSLNNIPYEKWTRNGIGIEIGKSQFSSDFDNRICSLKKGDLSEFTVSFDPSFDNADVAGQDVFFKAEVVDVRSRKLPDLDDIFAKKASSFETMADFRESLASTLQKQLEEESENEFEKNVMDEVLKNTSVEIQPILISRELEFMLNQFKNSLQKSNLTLDMYLSFMNISLDQFKESQLPLAEKKVKSDLTLDEIAKKESIEASESDLIEEIKNWNLPNLKEATDIKKRISSLDLEELKVSVKRKKTMAFLLNQAKII